MFGIGSSKARKEIKQMRERLDKIAEKNAGLVEKVKTLQSQLNGLAGREKLAAEKAQERTGEFNQKLKKNEERLEQLSAIVRTLPDPAVARELEKLRLLCGSMAAQKSRSLPADGELAEAEFKISSQWGEDGILQFLLAHVPIENEVFVEFGVQDYTEANTRFLLTNNNWKGLILDGSKEWMAAVRKSELAWRYTLSAVDAWITAENINDLIKSAGISGDIGLLSVDVDGNDYWIWKAIEVVQPRIVVCEYNSLFGPEAAVTVPYAPDFQRSQAHPSCVFYGTSIAALESLGQEKGYRLIGSNSHGNNVFFVRADLPCAIPARTARAAYRESRFRESRGEAGLSYASFEQAKALISECEVHDVRSNKRRKLSEAS